MSLIEDSYRKYAEDLYNPYPDKESRVKKWMDKFYFPRMRF